MKAFRLVEVKNGSPHTLFHGIPNGNIRGTSGHTRTRKIPLGKWLRAENKLVSDGTSKHKHISGFNVLLDLEKMREYAKRFTADRDLQVIPIEIRGEARKKPYSRAGVWLANWMKIGLGWRKFAIPLGDFK